MIYGQWGFGYGQDTAAGADGKAADAASCVPRPQQQQAQQQRGAAVLLVGERGVGKKTAAKALGFEVGKPLKMVSCAQLFDMQQVGDTIKRLSAVFDDARLMDAVLVLG